ncbi:metal-dependent hydrolase [bacterium]|nr:metal-dependent hydrolase [bacterium]
MDSLTQIVLGAAVGEVCLGKKAGNKAILWGAIAGTIPDLDVLVKVFANDLTANEMHRGFSHSILFCLIMAPILGRLIQYIYRNKLETTNKDWTKLSFWAFFTHPMLDAHTTWGTQLFWPFDLRIAYKNINVVDPIYTVPFLILVAIAMFYKRENKIRRTLAWCGIALSSAYLTYTVFVKFHVNSIFETVYEKHEIQYNRYTTEPTILNSILWEAIAETDSGYYIGYYSLFDFSKEVDLIYYEKDIELQQKLSKYRNFERLERLSDHYYLVYEDSGEFIFKDMRFGQTSFEKDRESIVFSYRLSVEDNNLRVVQEDPPRDNMKPMFLKLISRIGGLSPSTKNTTH